MRAIGTELSVAAGWRLAHIVCLALASVCWDAQSWDVAPVSARADAPGNVVADPSLEAGGWQTAEGAALSRQARSGRTAARIARVADRAHPRVECECGPAAPGEWTLSAWFRSDMPAIGDPNFGAVLSVTWSDDRGREVGRSRGLHVDGVRAAWTYREARVSAPTGARKARLSLHFVGSVCGSCEMDDVTLTPAAPRRDRARSETRPLRARPTERIFAPGEPVVLAVTLPREVARPARITAKLLGSRGRLLAAAEPVSLSEGDKSQRAQVRFPSTGLPASEWLAAAVSIEQQGRVWGTQVGALVRPRPKEFGTEADSPFALLVGHAYTMRWLGARWNRPNFAWHDRAYELARRYGVTTVAMVNQTTRALHGTMPADEYAAFVEESVGKYKNLLRWWQMGNEPPLFRPGMAEEYVRVLKIGYEAAKRANRDCVVVMGGLTGLNVDPDMLAKFLDAGGAKWCDVIDLHMYVPNPMMDDLLTRARSQMAARGVDKPIILTEVTGALGKKLHEREKAGHVYKRYATALSHGVKQLYWFVMYWVNDQPGGHQHCGLMDVRTRAPWPAAAAYGRLSDALTGAAFVRRQVERDGPWIFEFRRGDRALWVAWVEQGPPRPVRLPCGPGQARLVDVAGHEWRTSVRHELWVHLTQEPVLLDLPAGDGPIGAGGMRFEPAQVTLSRGGSARFQIHGARPGAVRYDAPAGLTVDGPVLRASHDAALTRSEVWAFTEHGRAQAVLRMPVTVTDPLTLAMAPMPAAGGAADAVRVVVGNLSPQTQSGTLTVVCPASEGLRPLAAVSRFSALKPGAQGQLLVPLRGHAGPLARSRCRVSVETLSGAARELTKTLVFAPASRFRQAPKIDGKLDEWGDRFPIVIGPGTGHRRDPKDGPPRDAADLSARAQVRWDASALYVGVIVRDDLHRNERRDGALWDGDSLQIGITPQPDSADAARAEVGCALTAHGPQTWAWRALPRAPTGGVRFPLGVIRSDGETVYEIAIPWQHLPGVEPRAGTWLGFGLLVNEQDTANRGHYGWHAGVSHPKNPALFGQITLVDE